MTASVAGTEFVERGPEELAGSAAEWLARCLAAGSERKRVCLSGGSTPQRLYELVAERHQDVIPWERIDWFWGDERCVPPNDERSNVGMAERVLFSRVPTTTRHPIPTVDIKPAVAAEQYAATLAEIYGEDRLHPDRPLFDVVLLGIGGDGHTASLFPGTAAVEERVRWAAPNRAPDGTNRVTLTFPALASAAHAAFLVAGAGKRAIVAEVRSGGSDAPAARYRPSGELVWFLDQDAAGA